MSKQLPENWTDKEFLEDATWLTPHERIEQEDKCIPIIITEINPFTGREITS